jgi:hypothetical protein
LFLSVDLEEMCVCWTIVCDHRYSKQYTADLDLLPAARSSITGFAPVVAIASSSRSVVSPVARRLLRGVGPVASSSSSSRVVVVGTPVAARGLNDRLLAALDSVAELVAVVALDAAPVLGLSTLASGMAFCITVAAAHHTRLGALARQVARLMAVVAGAVISSTTGSAHGLARLSAVRLAMTSFAAVEARLSTTTLRAITLL